jgi:hypothetical protein
MEAYGERLDTASPSRADPALTDYAPPARRPLRIYAYDPMLARLPDNVTADDVTTVEIDYERLAPGPRGEYLQVVDYDGACKTYYAPVDLEHPNVLLQDGLRPTESDPRFHQQMVYAVAMKVIENFRQALGRRIDFGRRPLRIFPHAFYGANAFYDPELSALRFGYFRADQDDPGPNLPGQLVFSCLSHDIIAHETTHALVDRLRPGLRHATNRDVYAFHEAFADIVAIFQHFTFRDILRGRIQETRSNLRQRTTLVELAQQFGYATGQGQALRSALDPDQRPDPMLYRTLLEPHDRGSILVAAIFDAYFVTYQKRIQDLLRIATGGTGTLPAGDLHPDLVNRIAEEAGRNAQNFLTMCIRAFDYLPPVDVTFGDFLRALITADYELVSEDRLGQRAAVIEAFRVRGVYPRDVQSLAEDSLLWPDRRHDDRLLRLPLRDLTKSLGGWAEEFSLREESDDGEDRAVWARTLHAYAHKNAAALELDPELPIRVAGFHSVFRVSPDGRLLREVVVQYSQRAPAAESVGVDSLGGLPMVGGTTVIFSNEGQVRYVVAKPLPSAPLDDEGRARAETRVAELGRFVEECDLADSLMTWADDDYAAQRMQRRFSFAAIHAASLARRARRP